MSNEEFQSNEIDMLELKVRLLELERFMRFLADNLDPNNFRQNLPIFSEFANASIDWLEATTDKIEGYVDEN